MHVAGPFILQALLSYAQSVIYCALRPTPSPPQSFDTVMAAIGSHPGHIQVQMEFERA